MLKFTFYFKEITHETLHLQLDKSTFVQLKITDVATSFILIVTVFDEAFEHGEHANFLGYVITNAGPLCRIQQFCATP
jgi:hypothetical protein